MYKNNELLWNIQFSQIGDVIFIVRDEQIIDNEESECCECIGTLCHILCHSVIINTCRCRNCLDPETVQYKAYRAHIDLFCDKILFSRNLMPDHMPHLYLDVLQRLNMP